MQVFQVRDVAVEDVHLIALHSILVPDALLAHFLTFFQAVDAVIQFIAHDVVLQRRLSVALQQRQFIVHTVGLGEILLATGPYGLGLNLVEVADGIGLLVEEDTHARQRQA